MKKLIVMLTLLLGSIVNAQSFDFSCTPQPELSDGWYSSYEYIGGWAFIYYLIEDDAIQQRSYRAGSSNPFVRYCYTRYTPTTHSSLSGWSLDRVEPAIENNQGYTHQFVMRREYGQTWSNGPHEQFLTFYQLSRPPSFISNSDTVYCE